MKDKITINKLFMIMAFAIFIFAASGCTTVLVAPYDEKLVTNTEKFYKKAAGVIEEGRSVSPFNNKDRKAIKKPSEHKGHFSKFETKYNDLLIDTETLILRTMASSNKIDLKGQGLQAKLEKLIDANIPSLCEELAGEFGKASLTAKNYIDLKCIILKWKEQHADQKLTKKSLILKKANWEGRKRTIFNAVLIIQKTEGFKKQEQKLTGDN